MIEDLRQLLRDAATDPARRPAFFRALMQGEIYLLGTSDRPSVGGRSQPDTHLAFISFRDETGSVTPIYTSQETLQVSIARRFGTARDYVRMPTRDAFDLLRGRRLVLDPDNEFGRTFTPEEVDALMEGRDFGQERVVVAKDTQVLVGAAAHIPPELPRVMAAFFATRPTVRQAHLGWIAVPEKGTSGYLVVVVADDPEAAMRGFGTLQIGDITGGTTVDVMVVPPSQPKHYLSNIPPFYQRSSGVGAKLGSFFGRRST